LEPAPPEGSPSRLFANSGYAVMRDGWGPQGNHLILDAGALGDPLSAGHGHAGLLAVQCAAFGEPALVDPGTGTYTEPGWRSHFRGTAAHSTVRVDGLGQAEPAGPFAWQQRPAARLCRWASTDAADFAEAEHDAYGRLADPVRHRRRVLFVKPRYWVLVDDLTGSARHQVQLRFQLAPSEVELEEDGWTRAVVGERALLLRSFASVPLTRRVRAGGEEPQEGWLSTGYGQWQPAPVVVLSVEADLPLRVVTLLHPLADPGAPAPPVRPLFQGPDPCGLVFGATGERVVEGPDGLWAFAGGHR
jgi:heparinase II/III-like protein